MEIIDPRGVVDSSEISISSATGFPVWPETFDERNLGILSNGKPNVADFFKRLCVPIQAIGAKVSCFLTKSGPMAPATMSELDQLVKHCDLVISGVADGGTATSWGVHDAKILRDRGLPVLLVCTSAFLPLAKLLLSERGEGICLLEISHPLSSLISSEVDDRVHSAFDKLKTIRPSGGAPVVKASTEQESPDHDTPLTRRTVVQVTNTDDISLAEQFYDWGWTDGLPVGVPEKERITAMMKAWPGSETYGDSIKIPPRNGLATPPTLVSNAILAGLPGKLLPYLAAAIQAVARPEFNLYGIQTTTNPVTPLIIVGGPERKKVGFNDGLGALGPGNRENATLGRALNLCLQNLGGVRSSDGSDPATLGQPGKYTFCFSENEDASSWQPLRLQTAETNDLRLSSDDQSVSVMAATGSVNMIIKATSGAELLDMVSKSINIAGSNDYMFAGHPLIIFCPEHAELLRRDKFSLGKIQEYLFESTKIPFSDFLPKNQEMMRAPRQSEFDRLEQDTLISLVRDPEELLVCVAGGFSMHSTFIPSFGGSVPVSAKVENL